MTDSTVLVGEREFARTYDGGNYDDAWRAVRQYRDVTSFSADNPDQSYVSIASALRVPETRVRSWVDAGKTPSVVAGLYIAHNHGWINLTFNDQQFLPLNILVASIYSGGMIASDHWQPLFTLNEAGFESKCVNALKIAGIGHTMREEGNENRRPSVRPGADGAILGRVLHLLGAPVGGKSPPEPASLPWYLDEAPFESRKRFVESYIQNRAITNSSGSVEIKEKRPRSYREELAELIESVTGERVTAGDRSVTLSADAVHAIGLESV